MSRLASGFAAVFHVVRLHLSFSATSALDIASAAAMSSGPLEDVGILRCILDYLAEEFLYVAAVSKRWRGCYKHPSLTSFKAAFETEARVKVAGRRLCNYHNVEGQLAAGRYAGRTALLCAFKLGLPLSMEVFNGAIPRKDVLLLQWLVNEDCKLNVHSALRIMIEVGSVELLIWLQQQEQAKLYIKWLYAAHHMEMAARLAHLQVCEFLYEQGVRSTSNFATTAAAVHCHFAVFDWLREHDFPWSEDEAARAAAHRGSAVTLEWLKSRGHTAWLQRQGRAAQTELLNSAGFSDHLEVAQWLRAQGVEWPQELYGWPERMLQWARSAGCIAPEIEEVTVEAPADEQM